MFRFIVFIIALTSLVFSLVAIMDYWKFDEQAQDIAALMKTNVTTQDFEQRIEQAIQNDNPEEARMYMTLAGRFAYAVDTAVYLPRIEALESTWNTTIRNVSRFTNGFIDGQGEDTAGVLGAVTADFTVVGDVRDLKEQYDLHEAGQEVNALIVGLAGVGVGLTAATIISSGTLAPAKAGSSALKTAVRANKVTPAFQRILLRQSEDVFDYQKFLLATRGERSMSALRRAANDAYNPAAFRALGETTERVNNIRRSTSLADTVDLMRYVENTDDLRRLEKVSAVYGSQTRGVMHLLGRAAIGTMRVLRHTVEFFMALAAAGASLLATILTITGGGHKKKRKKKGKRLAIV